MRLTLQMGTALHAFGLDLTRLSPGKGTCREHSTAAIAQVLVALGISSVDWCRSGGDSAWTIGSGAKLVTPKARAKRSQ